MGMLKKTGENFLGLKRSCIIDLSVCNGGKILDGTVK
jgi:hypothetical protein